MCVTCGYNPCTCSPLYSYNWYNTENYPCNPCSTTTVCKKEIPIKCSIYRGPNLTGLGLTTDINVELILATISAAIATISTTITTKNTNILTALNDINTRINTITGGSHPAYTI